MFGLAETRIQHLECNSEAANFIQFLLMKIWISWNSLDPSGTRRFKLTQGTQVNKSRFGTCCFFLSWFRWYADRFTHLLSLKSARASSVNLPLPPSHDLKSSCSFPSQLFPRKFRTKPPKTGKFHHPPPQFPSTSNIQQIPSFRPRHRTLQTVNPYLTAMGCWVFGGKMLGLGKGLQHLSGQLLPKLVVFSSVFSGNRSKTCFLFPCFPEGSWKKIS